MNKILFDATSTSPISELIAIAPGDCILLNAWGLGPGELAQVYRVSVALGNIPEQQSGSCAPPPAVVGAAIQTETPFFPCNVPVQVGEDGTQNITSLVIQQPGFYRVHLTPAALGTAVVEAVVLTGEEACAAAARQCCCTPETFWIGVSTNPCLVITPGGTAGHEPVFSLDACCLLHAFPALPVPLLTDELVVLSGGQCFRSTIAQVFDPAIICTTLGTYLLQAPAVGDTIVVIDAGLNCFRRDAETLVEFFETPWTGISVTPALTIAPGGINGHGPTFAYDLCADLQAIAPCVCEPAPGDLVPIIQGGACTLAQWPEVDACAQFGLLPTGAILAGDQVVVRDAGGACKLIDAVDFLVTPFPLLAPDGSCASPSYSFTSSPDSGMFYDPAGLGSVVIGDDNCADFIAIGASITIQTAASNVVVTSGADITAVAAVDVAIAGANDANISATAGTARFLSAGGTAGVVADSAGNVTATNATGAALRVLVTGSVVAMTAGLALEITSAGELVVNGDPGVATEVLSSNGPGLAPTWEPAGAVAFPLLAPDGTCAAPSYSFTSSPDSGMFYDPVFTAGGSVRIGHDNCTGFISVGAAIDVVAPTSTIALLGNGIGITSLIGLALGSGGVPARLTLVTTGDWNIGGSVGAAGDVITSNGAGVAPTWQAPTTSFPLLAPNGNCAAPSYSFTASPDSGMFYSGTSVVIGDDNCVDTIEVGASINLTATSTITNTSGGGFLVNATGIVLATGGPSATLASSGGSVSLEAAVGGVSFVSGAVLRFSIEPLGAWNIGGSSGTAGQVITSNGVLTPPTWQSVPTQVGSTLTWGATNLSNTTDTRVIPPGYNDGVILNTDTPRGFGSPRAGTIRNLIARHNLTNGNGNSVVYTVRVNGILSALTVTLATGAVGQASDFVNSVAVAQGDLVELVRIIAVGIGSGVQNAIISAQFN